MIMTQLAYQRTPHRRKLNMSTITTTSQYAGLSRDDLEKKIEKLENEIASLKKVRGLT